ncbi:MAG: glycosyltransferase family 4 protein [Steroidobacteraceae bacterium]|nr:glycosyltransferase family 4 protein [Steroidobacteraceae bacterium]
MPGPARVFYVEGNSDGTVGGSFILMMDLILGLDRSRFEPIALFRFENFVAERLRASGVEVIIDPPRVPFTFRSTWAARLLAPVKKMINFFGGFVAPALRYAAFLRKHRIQLVNLNNSITRNHPWMVAALLTRTPCVTHEMGINPSYSPLSRFLGRRLDAVISLSHAIHDAMKARGADLPNVVVIHCGIDVTRYAQRESPEELRRKHAIPEGAPVIGVVGNLRYWKGQETIVRATGILRLKYPELRCILAGADTPADRAYVEGLRTAIEDLGIQRNVLFVGFQDNAIDYMRLMDVVAHTSVSPEPFGIVTLEAMSLGKPLVSTTIGGPAEVVVNGVTGLLVEPGKPELLAAAIARLLDDRQAAAEMGERGRQRLHDEFSLEKNLRRTLEVYERVLNVRMQKQGVPQNEAIHP